MKANLNKVIEGLAKELGQSSFLSVRLNEYQQKAFDCEDFEKFIFGGNRSGKSFTIMYVLACLAAGIYRIRGRAKLKRRYNVWISSLDANLTKQVIIPLMRKVVPEEWLSINENRNYADIKSSVGIHVHIDFKSVDAGREKYQGASVDMIFLDEEHPKDIYDECLMRILDVKGQIITAMTPLKGQTWIYEYSRPRFNITLPTESNPILTKDEIDAISAGFSEKEKAMRLRGEFVDMSGAKFLDADEAKRINDYVIAPMFSADYVDGCFHQYGFGQFQFFHMHYDVTDRFIVSVDPASGSGRDYTIIDIYRYKNGVLQQFGIMRSRNVTLPDLARIVVGAAKYFNEATINIDATGIGLAVLQDILLTLKYLNVYVRENPDALDFVGKYGWRFTANSRTYLLAELKKHIQKDQIEFFNKQTVDELTHYAYDMEAGRYDHMKGESDLCHDDCIMAAGMAVITAKNLFSYVKKEEKEEAPTNEARPMTWNEYFEYEKSQLGIDEEEL